MPLIRRSFRHTLQSRSFQTVAILMAIYHLNPFTQASIYLYLTGPLQLDDSVYGQNLAWASGGGLVATIAYGAFVTRLPIRVRTHIGVAAGVSSNLVYLGLSKDGPLSAMGMTVGFCYMFGGLSLIDLAARSCPGDATGTVYATFMALCNLCGALATWFGGELYSSFTAQMGPDAGFRALIWCGATVTAICWLILPILPWNELSQTRDDHFGPTP